MNNILNSKTQDVLHAVIELGNAEKVTDDEMCLLKTAALFHDSGFLLGYQHHEMSSCNLAKEILPVDPRFPLGIETILTDLQAYDTEALKGRLGVLRRYL